MIKGPPRAGRPMWFGNQQSRRMNAIPNTPPRGDSRAFDALGLDPETRGRVGPSRALTQSRKNVEWRLGMPALGTPSSIEETASRRRLAVVHCGKLSDRERPQARCCWHRLPRSGQAFGGTTFTPSPIGFYLATMW